MHLRWGLRSITGDYRENNEDRGFADAKGRFFIVCDGMGGQAAGEKASEMAVKYVTDDLEKLVDFEHDSADKVRTAIDESLRHANIEIMALGEVDPQLCKMGTTIVFLVSVAGRFYVGGVGDSPAFRLSNGTFEKLTKDHSLTQALIDAGTITPDEARTHRFKNVLWRYIGTKEGAPERTRGNFRSRTETGLSSARTASWKGSRSISSKRSCKKTTTHKPRPTRSSKPPDQAVRRTTSPALSFLWDDAFWQHAERPVLSLRPFSPASNPLLDLLAPYAEAVNTR